MAYPAKARFLIAAEASADGKTTIHNVKQIQFDGSEEIYVFPIEKQLISLHELLLKRSAIVCARKALTSRNKYRNTFVTFDDELAADYLDVDGNPVFKGDMLEEISFDERSSSSGFVPLNPPPSIQTVGSTKSFTSVMKDAVLEKFAGKQRNPVTWIDNLETECNRLGLATLQYCEAMRLYLEGPAMDWYITTRTLLGGSASWERWRMSFLNAFSCRGWSEVCNAMNYRYSGGSLNEYMIKKLSLLIDMDPKMSDNMQICGIVVGLPSFARERLDRAEIKTVNELFAKVNIMDRSDSDYNKRYNNFKKGFKNRDSVMCDYCNKKGYPGRKHAESDCYYKKRAENNKLLNENKSQKPNEKKSVKMINNTEFEEFFEKDVNQKN